MNTDDRKDQPTTRIAFGFREGLMFGLGFFVPMFVFFVLVTGILAVIP
jgi:hypothetical protein